MDLCWYVFSYIASLILSIECLLIFVQYEIGIEYKKGDKKVLSVETLVTYELILTLGLALLIFLRDYVTSLISIVIGNRFYETSLNNVSNKHINMLSKPDFPLLANRYNRVLHVVFRTIDRTSVRFNIYSTFSNSQ